MTHRDAAARKRLAVLRAKVRARAAEKRVVARARAWYVLHRRDPQTPDDVTALVCDLNLAMGCFITALGLDEEARSDLRAARRRCR